MEGSPPGGEEEKAGSVQEGVVQQPILDDFLLAVRVGARTARRKLRLSSRTVKQIGSFLTGLATIIGAIAVFLPLHNDGPDVSSSNMPVASEPGRLSATLTDTMIDDVGVSLGDFCEQRDATCEGYGPSQRQWPGITISYAILAEGYEGQQLSLSWSMYSVTPRSRLDDPALLEQPGWPDGIYTPGAESDRNSGEIWVPYPPTAGEYFVRLELHPPSGARLDAADSESFTVTND